MLLDVRVTSVRLQDRSITRNWSSVGQNFAPAASASEKLADIVGNDGAVDEDPRDADVRRRPASANRFASKDQSACRMHSEHARN